MKQNIFPRLKRVFTGIVAGTLALIWWGVLYPELCFPQDTYDVVYETESEEISGDESCAELLWADEEQIVVKSRLLEWIKNKRSLNVK